MYCPGCGITRAIKAALRFDFYNSFRNNVLLYIVIPPIFIVEILKLRCLKKYELINKFCSKFKKISNVWYVFLLIIVIGYGVLRNIPTFSFLVPIEENNESVLIDLCKIDL